MKALKSLLLISITLLLIASCQSRTQNSIAKPHTLRVTATAYNSLPAQTSGNPAIGAWGDRLKPGMKVIAVSRDLIRMGLTHNRKVTIEGLPGYYLVKDKMAKRWHRKIDIYMGRDRKAARHWGKRTVTIHW